MPAALNLLRRFRQLELPVAGLLTSAGETEIARLIDGVPFRTLRADRLGRARGFLDRWRPDVAVWTECDLRPALVSEIAGRGIPLFLVDTATARPDFRAWRWRLRTGKGLMAKFDGILAGDEAFAEDLRRLGAEAERIEVLGTLEEGPPPPLVDETDLDDLSHELAARPVWLAAHVVPGMEMDAVIEAHRRGLQRAHRLLLVLSPDNLEAGPGLAERLSTEGWTVALRSRGEAPTRETQIYVADVQGERGLWYRLAPISFLGRSLAEGGGLNPFEAAALGSAVLHGPNVRIFRAEYARLSAAGATRLVKDSADLSGALETLLAPDKAAEMAQAAWSVSSAGAAVTDRIVELVTGALEEKGLL